MTSMHISRLWFSRCPPKFRCFLRAIDTSRCCSSSTPSPSTTQPIVELREDSLIPNSASKYVTEITTKASSLLRETDDNSLVSPLRFFSLPSTGGPLHVATHAYYFDGGLADREMFWKSSMEDEKIDNGWQSLVNETTRPSIQSQKSMLFVEAPLVQEANLPGLKTGHTNLESLRGTSSGNGIYSQTNCILEIRRYHLKLGYDTVPKFLELYGRGLLSKLASTDPTTTLVTLLYSEVGRLNEVIEIWRHGDGVAAMEKSRVGARQAEEWRTAIANIADLAIEFQSTIHRPLSFSPIK